MRTTIDIDDPILKEVKSLKRRKRASLGRVVSDLLALGLKARDGTREDRKPPRWVARAMTARVDLSDKEAVYAAMERNEFTGKPARR